VESIICGVVENLFNNSEDAELLYMHLAKLYVGNEYHNLQHINQMLKQTNQMLSTVDISSEYRLYDCSERRFFGTRGYPVYNSDIRTFVLAVLFHNARVNYDDLDVERSKELALSAIKWFNLVEDVNLIFLDYLIECANYPILESDIQCPATLTTEQIMLGKIIHDADLMILGSLSFVEYVKYVGCIYSEVERCSKISKSDFINERIDFLRKMCEKDIFWLNIHKDTNGIISLEDRARKNIEREFDMYFHGISITF
jgi:predicted metal-dependent HD superfamily phosphohydrolase